MPQKLLFVYKAKRNAGSQVLDFVHKIMSPATYDCQLCTLTFGRFRENKQWKAFRKNLLSKGYELSFLHKDEFQKNYKSKFVPAFTFPIVLTETPYDLEVLVPTEQLNKMRQVGELVAVLEAALKGKIS